MFNLDIMLNEIEAHVDTIVKGQRFASNVIPIRTKAIKEVLAKIREQILKETSVKRNIK